eukprot:258194-Chlamydomonas_euryale.AAC.1
MPARPQPPTYLSSAYAKLLPAAGSLVRLAVGGVVALVPKVWALPAALHHVRVGLEAVVQVCRATFRHTQDLEVWKAKQLRWSFLILCGKRSRKSDGTRATGREQAWGKGRQMSRYSHSTHCDKEMPVRQGEMRVGVFVGGECNRRGASHHTYLNV